MKTRLAIAAFAVVGVVLVFLWVNRPEPIPDEAIAPGENDLQSAAPADRVEAEASTVDPAKPVEVVSADAKPSTGVALSGVVHDARTNLPVENALVALEGEDATLSEARSGADGAFELSIDAALSRTDLSLTAKAEGYVTSRRPVESLGDLEPGGAVVRLVPSSRRLARLRNHHGRRDRGRHRRHFDFVE
jgi:hypothetical protein